MSELNPNTPTPVSSTDAVASVAPGTGLARTTKETAMVLVTKALRDFPKVNLGSMSLATFANHVAELGLDEDDVDHVVWLRDKCEAHLPTVFKLMGAGMKPERIELIMVTQEGLRHNHAAIEGSTSIGDLNKFIRIFNLREMDPGEIGDLLARILKATGRKYVGGAIADMETLAQGNPGVSLDGLLHIMELQADDGDEPLDPTEATDDWDALGTD